MNIKMYGIFAKLSTTLMEEPIDRAFQIWSLWKSAIEFKRPIRYGTPKCLYLNKYKVIT